MILCLLCPTSLKSQFCALLRVLECILSHGIFFHKLNFVDFVADFRIIPQFLNRFKFVCSPVYVSASPSMVGRVFGFYAQHTGRSFSNIWQNLVDWRVLEWDHFYDHSSHNVKSKNNKNAIFNGSRRNSIENDTSPYKISEVPTK